MSSPIRIFLASSCELATERREFEIFINRKNNDWHAKGIFLKLEIWEDFLDAMSRTRLQDEYNKTIRDGDLFVMLCHSKVGPYTAEEFATAFGQFQSTGKPFIFTYFKNVALADADDSLFDFKKKLKELGHFPTFFDTTDGLLRHFGDQLDKLASNGFITFPSNTPASANTATNTGNGAINQGSGAAIGAGGVYLGGANSGTINTGTMR